MGKTDDSGDAASVGGGLSSERRDFSVEGGGIASQNHIFRSLADHSQEFIGMCDLELRPFYVNEAGMKLVGLRSIEEACAVRVQDLFFPEDQRFLIKEFLPKVLREKTGEVEIRFRHFKTGEAVWVLCNIFQVRDAHGRVSGYATVSRDITERKRAEVSLASAARALERERDILQAVMNGAKNSHLVYLDRDFNFVRVNDTYAQTCGYRPEEMIGKNHFALYPHAENEAIFARVRDTGEPVVYHDKPFEFPDKPERGVTYWDWTLTPMKDSSGQVAGLILSLFETTLRKRVEEALRQSEERLRLITDRAPVMLGHWDTEHRFKFANATYTSRFGLSPEQVIGKHLRDVVGEQAYERIHPWLEKGLRGEIADYELQVSYFGGPPQWLRITYTREFSPRGEVLGIIAAIKDITDRKCVQDALRASEEAARGHLAELEALYAAAPVGLCVFDRELRFRRINQRLAEINGLPMQAHLGKTVHEVVPALAQQAEEVFRKVIATGQPVRIELRGSTAGKPGEQRVWDERWFPLRHGDEIDSVGVVVEDITERKAFQAELERLVAEQTAYLHELVGELEHLSYTITHDMRAPLRAMRGFAEAIQELCAENRQPELDIFVQRLMQGAKRMDLLITDALQYTKALRQEIPLAPVDLGRLLRGILETYPQFIDAGIELVEPVLPVLGNEAALTQCFSNLIGNAVKFVKAGEKPKVRVWAEQVAEPGSGSAGGRWIRVWVEDQGIGISRQMQSKLFQMFSRESRDYEGTGIGLALVRKVVQRMGGRVGVDSQQGKGSRFWVELPSADAIGAPFDRHGGS